MRTFSQIVMTLFCLVVLLGCSVLYPPEKQGRSALDDFVYALRWQQFNAAAGFMKPELREDFLDQFKDLKDLTIVDVRLKETLLTDEGRRADTLIEMDYYLLPSATIKTFEIAQTWEHTEVAGDLKGRYQIITPFPPFP